MNDRIEQLKKTVEPLRQEIIEHKVYAQVNDIDDLKVFMQYHVFAVWDFMSLLKALQNNLTCTTVPWFPKGDADTRFLINEIVTGEESDVDQQGNRMSHFELYLQAMKQCGADTSCIENFVTALQNGSNLEQAFELADVATEARDFVRFTFDTIESNKAYLQSAVFTFGREDLIPGMFVSMINDMYQNVPGSVSVFKYYLERHIEVDGDHHSHLALQMTANLCGNNEAYWAEATEATIRSLEQRKALWQGVYNKLEQTKLSVEMQD